MTINITCPIHKDERLHILYYYTSRKVKKGGNIHGSRGFAIRTDYAFCKKCDKVRKVKVKVS